MCSKGKVWSIDGQLEEYVKLDEQEMVLACSAQVCSHVNIVNILCIFETVYLSNVISHLFALSAARHPRVAAFFLLVVVCVLRLLPTPGRLPVEHLQRDLLCILRHCRPAGFGQQGQQLLLYGRV